MQPTIHSYVHILTYPNFAVDAKEPKRTEQRSPDAAVDEEKTFLDEDLFICFPKGKLLTNWWQTGLQSLRRKKESRGQGFFDLFFYILGHSFRAVHVNAGRIPGPSRRAATLLRRIQRSSGPEVLCWGGTYACVVSGRRSLYCSLVHRICSRIAGWWLLIETQGASYRHSEGVSRSCQVLPGLAIILEGYRRSANQGYNALWPRFLDSARETQCCWISMGPARAGRSALAVTFRVGSDCFHVWRSTRWACILPKKKKKLI